MDNYTIEFIKQVGAVALIAIILVKQNGKNFGRLLSITDANFSKLFDKLDDLVHRVDHTYLSSAEVEDTFSDISEVHKLRKFKVLIHAWTSLQTMSIALDILESNIESEFKTITREEVIKLNKIKSHCFNKDLGTKFMKKIDWKMLMAKTMLIIESSTSISELEKSFFALADEFLIEIRTDLKI